MISPRAFSRLVLGACTLLSVAMTQAQSGDGGDDYPIAEFLPAALVKELGDKVAPGATLHDARATFTVNTPQGSDTVQGTVNMLERVTEMRAVETLEAMKRTDVYLDAIKNSAKAPVNYGKAMVDAPVNTIKDTAKGLGGFFADVGYSIVSDDPSQDNVAKTGLGQSAAKRAFAFELGVNPYSQYKPLQDNLSEVSWTAVGGGLTVGVAFRAVRNTPGQVLQLSRVANTGRELVRDNSPRQLKIRNKQAMHDMGVGEALSEAMLSNFNFDPETETRLIVALESMDGVAARPEMIGRATLAGSRDRAAEMRDWAELLASFHARVVPGRKLVVISNVVYLVDAENRAHGVFPTDYVVPTPTLGAVLRGLSLAVKKEGYALGSLYITGAVHPQALEMLEDAGWQSVQPHAEKILRDG